MRKVTTVLLSGFLLFGPGLVGTASAEADEANALKLIRESKCARCHEVDKPKKGTPYAQTAENYRDKPNAVDEVIEHITKRQQVEVDGEMVDHGTARTRDAARVKNLAEWILSR